MVVIIVARIVVIDKNIQGSFGFIKEKGSFGFIKEKESKVS